MAIIQTQQSDIHWNYFLALEKDLETASRYIEFCEPNYPAYSIELAHLLFAAASEVDVLAKVLCELLEPGKRKKDRPKNICDYQKVIMSHLHEFPTERVFIPRYYIEFQPWDNWLTPENPPYWWTSYNHVKHSRNENFHEATLKNALRAMGGLLVMLFFTKRQALINKGVKIANGRSVLRTFAPESNLIRLDGAYYVQLLAVN